MFAAKTCRSLFARGLPLVLASVATPVFAEAWPALPLADADLRAVTAFGAGGLAALSSADGSGPFQGMPGTSFTLSADNAEGPGATREDRVGLFPESGTDTQSLTADDGRGNVSRIVQVASVDPSRQGGGDPQIGLVMQSAAYDVPSAGSFAGTSQSAVNIAMVVTLSGMARFSTTSP